MKTTDHITLPDPSRSRGRLRRAATVGLGLAVAAAAALAAPTTAQAATTPITICSQDASWTYNILGSAAQPLREKLDTPAHFGAGGTYGDYSFTYVDLGSTVTEAGLDANGCDIYFSGYEFDGNYTATELTELSSWTSASPTHQVMAGCDSTSYDPVCDLLNFTVTTDTDTYGFAVDNPGNPINCDGSLAPGDEINMAGGVGGYFSGSGVTASNVLAVHETGGAADPSKPIAVYTGSYFLTSDVNMFEDGGSETTLSPGDGVVTNNDKLAMNAVSALSDVASGVEICSSAGPAPVVPEVPLPVLLPLLGAAVLVLTARLRRA